MLQVMVYRPALFLVALALRAEDPRQTALVLQAQADFDRVESASKPDLVRAATCVQSQASLLPVSAPENLSMIHYRRGYCALAGALIALDRHGFEDAARSFEQAIAAWPTRPRNKKAPVEPVSAGLVALHAIARLEAGAEVAEWPELDRRLDEARRSAACPSGVVPTLLCRQLSHLAGSWRGWIAVRQGRNVAAEQAFASAPAPGWADWLLGRRAFENRRYREAADAFRRSLDAWSAAEKNRVASIPGGLNPPGDPSSARLDLAESLIAAGDARAALPVLEMAMRQGPVRPWTYFLRGRAREEAGTESAASDYNLAARTALAAGEEATGEARFYRGVWLYRRGEFARAEEEFADALNAGIGEAPGKADARAWRNLAAVAAGACDATREKLAAALGTASPLFPSAEARKMIQRCAGQRPFLSEAR